MPLQLASDHEADLFHTISLPMSDKSPHCTSLKSLQPASNENWMQDVQQNDHEEHIRMVRRVIPSLPRPQTFHRQQSEKRERLLEVQQPGRRSASAQQGPAGLRPSHGRILPSSSAPDLHMPQHTRLSQAQTVESTEQRKASGLQYGDQDNDADFDLEDERDEEDISDAAVRQEYDEKWILNLSMHFRDKSNREKFFVTYAQTPNKWRRLTISLDYRSPPPNSLEAEISELHYQRDKSFRIFDALRDSLPDIQFYDTVTNLKLETTPEDGQLHVHVREDANEIIEYPSTQLVQHVACPRYRESCVAFHSHVSGFVYKVRVEGRLMIKKEIPGPNTIDEFLYELNALNSLQGQPDVIQLRGLVVDDTTSLIKGLLIDYACKGALADVLYDSPEELPLWLRQKWAVQITKGLSAIHEAGFVQGDFTLSNMVIDENDDAKIIDINRRGCPVGWEPPELAQLIENGQRISMLIGVKTDLYQLGMTLWALCEHDDEPERSRPLQPINASLPSHYQYIISSCLSDKPQGRMSAREILHILEHNSDGGRSYSEGGSNTHSQPEKSHLRDKEYIDPALAVTIEEVRSYRNPGDDEVAIGAIQAAHSESRPPSSAYHFESSGSWIMPSRGRSRRRSDHMAIHSTAASSATSVSKITRSDCEQAVEAHPTYPVEIMTADLGLPSNQMLSPLTSQLNVFRHHDSGFDEQMTEDVERLSIADDSAKAKNDLLKVSDPEGSTSATASSVEKNPLATDCAGLSQARQGTG